jgi:ankyrin repeat protein
MANVTPDTSGRPTELMAAAAHGDTARINQLLGEGADRTVTDCNGWTALDWTRMATNGCQKAAAALLEASPAPKAQKAAPAVALTSASIVAEFQRAALTQDTARMEELLDEGLDVNATNSQGMATLRLIAPFGLLKSANVLFKHHVDVNAEDSLGWAPLYASMMSHQIGMDSALLKNGADVNKQDRKNRSTVTMYAVLLKDKKGVNREEVKLFVNKYHADLTITDANGLTAYDIDTAYCSAAGIAALHARTARHAKAAK